MRHKTKFKTDLNWNGNKFVMTYIFLISSVGSARMTNRPSSISGRKIMRSMSGTASSTEIQEMTNWRANVFLVNTRSRSEGMNPTKSNVALSVTMSWQQRLIGWGYFVVLMSGFIGPTGFSTKLLRKMLGHFHNLDIFWFSRSHTLHKCTIKTIFSFIAHLNCKLTFNNVINSNTALI